MLCCKVYLWLVSCTNSQKSVKVFIKSIQLNSISDINHVSKEMSPGENLISRVLVKLLCLNCDTIL